MGTPVLLLGKSDIERTMTLRECIDAVEGAFRDLAAGRITVAPVVHVPGRGGGFHIKSAARTCEPHYVAVKVNGNFPGNPRTAGLPTIQGAIVLCDGANGTVLSIMDSTTVTAMRTAAATAVAARHLAAPDATHATIIGCGLQGHAQLLGLREVLPLETIHAFDLDVYRRDEFVRRQSLATGLDVVAADELAHATRQSRVIVTCTTSRDPVLSRSDVAPGTFIAAVGADNGDKQELEVDLMAQARVVVDVLDQCAEIGELHHALAAGVMRRGDVVAELADIVVGTAKVDSNGHDIVVFDSTGSAIQDVAAAGLVYERARAAGTGTAVDFI